MAYDGTLKFDTSLDTKGVTSGIKNLAGTLISAFAGTQILSAIGNLSSSILGIGTNFEAAMSRVSAIAGAYGSDLSKLTEQAKKLGADTAFSAQEAAAGMENLASAGFSVADIMSAMPGLLDMAAVSGGDVGAAAEIAANALNGFDISAENAAHIADVFARAAADTNAETLDMGEAMKYVAPVAHAMGLSLEETAAAIGIMSDAGIKGSQAGTSLRGALARLAKPTTAMSAVMNELGISFYDAQGNMLPLEEQVVMLKDSFAGLTQEQQNNALVTLFGQESLSGMMALIEAGPDKLDSLTTSLINSDGAAKQMATTIQDNLKGDVEALSGSFETLGIQIFERFNLPLREAVQAGSQAIDELSNELSAPEMKKNIDNIANALSDFAGLVIDLATGAIKALITVFGTLAEYMYNIIPAVAAVAASLLAFNTIAVMTEMVAALAAGFTVLESAMLAIPIVMNLVTAAQAAFAAATLALSGPFMPLIAAIGAVTFVLANYLININKATEEEKALKKETKDLASANDALLNSIGNTAAKYDEVNRNMSAEAETAKSLADRLFKMSDAEKKTAEGQARMKMYVDGLNKAMPDLNLAFDKQGRIINSVTGELYSNADALKDVINANKLKLEQQAAEERYVELLKEEFELKEQQAVTEANIRDIRERIDSGEIRESKVKKELKELVEQQALYTTELGKNAEEQAALDAVYAEVIKKQQEQNQLLTESEQALADTSEAVKDYASITHDSVYDFIESLGLSDDALESNMKTLEKYSSEVANIFSKLEAGAAKSFEEIKSTLEFNIKAMEDWSENMAILAERGIDEGLLQQLREGGPEARLTVAALVNATDEELAELETLMVGAAQASTNAFLVEIGEAAKTVPAETAMLISETKQAMDMAVEEGNFAETGANILNKVLQSISNDATLSDSARAKIEEIRTAIQEASLSGDFESSVLPILAQMSEALSSDETVPDSLKLLWDTSKSEFENHLSTNNLADSGETIVQQISDSVEQSDKLSKALGTQLKHSRDKFAEIVNQSDFDQTGDKAMENTARGINDSNYVELAISAKMSEAKELSVNEVTNSNFEETGEQIVTAQSDGISQNDAADKAITETVQEIYKTADEEIEDLEFWQLGEAIVSGMIEGINNSMSKLKAAAIELARAAYESARAELDINSPSRKFRYLAEMTVKGYEDGLQGGEVKWEKAFSKMVADAVATVDAQHYRVASAHAENIINNSTRTVNGGNLTFEPGSIVFNEASINNSIDRKKLGRDIAIETDKQIRLRGGLIPR